MKLAFMITCHMDHEHIARLAKKLATHPDNKVYIHVDQRSDINAFKQAAAEIKNVYFCKERYKTNWSSFQSIQAVMALTKNALADRNDRLIMMQGLDYSLYSNELIHQFFNTHRNIEFIRACNVTTSTDYHIACKIRQRWFFGKDSKIYKIWHRFNTSFKIYTRKPSLFTSDNKQFDIYFGNATWALTQKCAQYVLDFYHRETHLEDFFESSFCSDELYVHSVVFNSNFASNTTNCGPEPEDRDLEQWQNLGYFEYGKNIKIFDITDFDTLFNTGYLFVRKTNSTESKELLDAIDSFDQAESFFQPCIGLNTIAKPNKLN